MGKKKQASRKIFHKLKILLIILCFTVGVLGLLYPYISEAWNRHLNRGTIGNYDRIVKQTDEKRKNELWKAAKVYNRKHPVNTLYDAFSGEKKSNADSEYEKVLNVNGEGMMGYLEIPAIDMTLSIYHGTSAKVLRQYVGHLPGTSLPVGGKGTHAVLSAHRGLPSAKLFTDLDQVKKGDLFYIYILDHAMAYEVDQIKVVTPDRVEDMAIDPEQDYVTLVTCTPYGVNTHRLLVRGHRTAFPAKPDTAAPRNASGMNWKYLIWAGIAAAVIILFLAGYRRRKRKRTQN